MATGGEEIRALRFSNDGQQLYTAGQSSLVTWDATLREDNGFGPDASNEFFAGYSMRTAVVSEDLTRIVLRDGSLRTNYAIWNAVTDQEVCRLKLDDTYSGRPALRPDGQRIAFGKRTRTPEEHSQIVIHDANTGERLNAISVAKSARLGINFYFRPDGKQIAALVTPTSSEKSPAPQRLMAWNAETQDLLYSADLQLGEGYAAELRGYSPDGSQLILGSTFRDFSSESALLLYDAQAGKLQRSLPLPGILRLMVVSFVGKSAVTISRTADLGQRFNSAGRGDVVVFDLESGAERVRLRGHGGFDNYEITPDGSRIILGNLPPSTGLNSTFSVWSLKSGRRLLEFQRQGFLADMNLSRDGNRLLAVFSRRPGYNPSMKPIQIWDATPLPEP